MKVIVPHAAPAIALSHSVVTKDSLRRTAQRSAGLTIVTRNIRALTRVARAARVYSVLGTLNESIQSTQGCAVSMGVLEGVYL